MSTIVWIVWWVVTNMEALGMEAIISLALAALTMIVSFIGHYFYVRGKLHKAAACAITNAEQDEKTGEEKLELAVDQVYGLVPTSLKVFIHRSSVRKIVQAAFDKIEDYARKQVEKKSKKREPKGSNDMDGEGESPSSEIIVSPYPDEFSDSGGESEQLSFNSGARSRAATERHEPDDTASSNMQAQTEIATTLNDDTAPDIQSVNQVKQSRECSTNKNSIQEKNIMENNQTNNIIDNEPVACYEDISARTEYSKQFNNPKTGVHTAVLFSSPVHSAVGDEMTDVDADFVDAVNDEGEEVYESRRNKFLVRLAKSTAQNKLVELIQDDYKIAMSPVAAVTSKLNRFVGSIRRDVQAIRNLRRSPKSAANKITELIHGAIKFAMKDQEPADVRFANIINNCDLEYLVENNRLKENIIVNAKSEAYEYMFNLNLGKLEARKNGKIIELYDAATNDVKFTIPAPYMYDMANKQSDAVEYMLEGSAGNYTLRVIADETWINSAERQFPVIIDPQIMGNTTDIISFKGGSRIGNFTTPTGDCIAIGNNHYNNADHEYTAQIILHGNAIRQYIGKDLKITHAVLELTKTGEDRASGSAGFNVRKDSVSGTVIDRFVYNGINNRIEIDITAQIQEIIDGTSDKSLFIDRVNTDSATDYLLIATALVANSEYKPRIFIDFVSSRLNTDNMLYASASAGKGGSGKVNLVTGNLVWGIPEIQLKSRGIELGISHIYDGYLAGKDQDYINSANSSMPKTPKLCCGKGFKLNIQQFLYEKKYSNVVSLLGTRNFVYIDGNGNHHDFVEKYYYTDDNTCKRYVERINCEEDVDGNLTIVVDGKSYNVEHEISNELGLKLETCKDLLEYTIDGKAYTVSYYKLDNNGKRYSVSADRAGEPGVFALRDYGDGIKINISDKIDMKEVEEAKAAMDDCELKLEEVVQQMHGVQQGSDAYKLLVSKQKRFELDLADKTMKYNKAVSNQKRSPVDFITDGNGQTLGFDYEGRLVLIGDGSKNGSAFIVYNSDNRIESVVDLDSISLVKFGYENDLLDYMTDKNGKTLRYQYTNSRLSGIVHGQDLVCKFQYSGDLLINVENDTYYGAEFSYDYNKKVTMVTEYSQASDISDGNVVLATGKWCAKKLSIARYDRYMVKVTNNISKDLTTYIVDNIGRIVTAYDRDDANARHVSIEYREHKRAYSGNDIYQENTQIDYMQNATNVTGKHTKTLVDTQKIALIPKSGMLLLSAWAQAQSFHLIYNRRQTAYGDDIFGHYELDANNSADIQRSQRTYGLFAKVYYQDGTQQEYKASFDYYNHYRQLGVLPIFVNTNKEITKIEYGVDYSNNNGTASFEDIKLTTCKNATYSEFDDDDNVIKEITNDGVTVYEYVDGKPIKATFTRYKDGKSFVSLCDYDLYGRVRYTRDFNGNCKAIFYNDSGRVCKTEEYNEADSTTKRVKEYKYDNDGNVVYESADRGEADNSELWNMNYIDNGVTTRTRNAGGAVTAYGYDHYTGDHTGLSGDADGNPNNAVYKYTHGFMTKATYNNTDIDYVYDGIGHVKSLNIGGKNIITSTYARDEYDCVYAQSTYANGLRLHTQTNNHGQIEYVRDIDTNQSLIINTYNGIDKISASQDNIANISYSYGYEDNNDNLTDILIKASDKDIHIHHTYDDENYKTETYIKYYNVSKTGNETTRSIEKEYCTTYEYEDRGTSRVIKSQTLSNNMVVKPQFDALMRYSGMRVQSGTNANLFVEERYYLKHGDRTSDLIASERFGINGVIDEHIKYSYDSAGNISSVTVNGVVQSRYSYDSLNRLVREENKAIITEYFYDVGGNITKKIKYDKYSSKKTEMSVYKYSAKGWRDQLLKINTTIYDENEEVDTELSKKTSCAYNALGLPYIYKDNILVWSKYGTLTSYGDKVSYTYGADGIRLSKTVGSVTTRFFVHNKKILRSVDSNYDIWYHYGATGIIGLTVSDMNKHTTNHYVFRKNAQGDVTHIYKLDNGSLNLEAEYTYDAWGNCFIFPFGMFDTIGYINPIRYRGYY